MDVLCSSGRLLCYEGLCKVSLLHFSLGKPTGLCNRGLGFFFQLESFPNLWENLGYGVMLSSGVFLQKDPAQKPAGPSRVPSDCGLGARPQSPLGSPLVPLEVPD